MPKILVEVTHEPTELACATVAHVFLTSGSHFLANAEWGCLDGDHSAWMIVDLDNKKEALGLVPQAFRPRARVVQLNRFTTNFIEDILRRHGQLQQDDENATP